MGSSVAKVKKNNCRLVAVCVDKKKKYRRGEKQFFIRFTNQDEAEISTELTLSLLVDNNLAQHSLL